MKSASASKCCTIIYFFVCLILLILFLQNDSVHARPSLWPLVLDGNGLGYGWLTVKKGIEKWRFRITGHSNVDSIAAGQLVGGDASLIYELPIIFNQTTDTFESDFRFNDTWAYFLFNEKLKLNLISSSGSTVMSGTFKSEIFQYSCFLTNASVIEVNSTASTRGFGFLTISSSSEKFTQTNLIEKQAAFENSLTYTGVFYQNSSSTPKTGAAIYGPANDTSTSNNKLITLKTVDTMFLIVQKAPIKLDSTLKDNLDRSHTYVQMEFSDGLIRGQVNPVNFFRRETQYPPELIYRNRTVQVDGIPRAVLVKNVYATIPDRCLTVSGIRGGTPEIVLSYDVPIIKPEFNDVRALWFTFNMRTTVAGSKITVEYYNSVTGGWDLGGTVSSGKDLDYVYGYDFIFAPTAWNYLILGKRRRDVNLKIRLSCPDTFVVDYAVIQVYVPRKYTNQNYRDYHGLD